MQSVAIILFIPDILFYGLTAFWKKTSSVTTIRNCSEKDTVILKVTFNASIWCKMDGHTNICLLSYLRIIFGFFKMVF